MAGKQPQHGPVETAVRGDIDAIDVTGSTARSLAAAAINLAAKLDADAGMATAAVSRELRETLKALADAAGDDDGSDLLAELSSQVGDTPAP